MKKWIKLENLIYLAIFLLPAYLIRLKFFSIPTNFFEITVGIIFIIWARNYVKARKFPDFGKIIQKKYFLPILFILGGLTVSTFSNPHFYKGIGIIKGWFFVPMLFSFIAFDAVPKEKLKNIFTAYYLSAFFVALASIFYLLSGSLTFDGRLEAFFNSPNYLAMYLSPAILIGLERVQSSKFKVQRLRTLSILIMLISFYFTYSYAAWLAVILSVISIFIIKKEISLKKTWLIFIILILLFFPQLQNPKMKDFINYNSRSSAASRIIIWKSAGKILKDNWAIGIGPGNFQEKYLEYQKYFPPYLEWAVPHPHNIFLAFWLSGGILGIIGFLWLVYLFFRSAYFILKKSETPELSASRKIIYISLIIIIYILIHGLFDTTYFKNDLAVVFWLSFLAVI